MNNYLFAYLIKAEISILLFYAGYYFFLKNDKMFVINRLYLMTALIFSLFIPLLRINISSFSENINHFVFRIQLLFSEKPVNTELIVETNTSSTAEVVISTINYQLILLYIYLAGVLFFFSKFIINISKLFISTLKNEIIIKDNIKYVLIKTEIVPYSFFNYIFISKADYTNPDKNELIIHEKTHVQQFHSFDIIFIELFQVIHWFNPFLIPFKRLLRANHEFLADNKVITQSKNKLAYQNKLLQLVFRNNSISLASNLNYSLTKKRLKMISKQNPGKLTFLKRLVFVPILAMVFLLFAGFDLSNANIKESTESLPSTSFSTFKEQSSDAIVNDTIQKKKKEEEWKEKQLKMKEKQLQDKKKMKDKELQEMLLKIEKKQKILKSKSYEIDKMIEEAKANKETEKLKELEIKKKILKEEMKILKEKRNSIKKKLETSPPKTKE